MKKCKYCQAELAENGTFCPVCGKENAGTEAPEETTAAEETAAVEEAAVPAQIAAEETPDAEMDAVPAEEAPAAEIKEGVKATPAKIAAAVAAVVVLAAVLIALIVAGMKNDKAEGDTIAAETTQAAEETVSTEAVPATVPADGNPDDVTCKGTYTADDEAVIAAADTIVATAGDFQLTNGQLQVYYWLEVQSFLNSYGYYAYYQYGLDYTQPLDTQVCPLMESGGTWQQFFLATALNSWQSYVSLANEAELENFQLDEETLAYLESLPESMESQAAEYGFEDVNALLAYNVGAGASMEDYYNFMERYYLGYYYFNDFYANIQPGEAEVEAYFDENEALYAENGLTKDNKYVDVRHILVLPEGATTETIYTETFSDEAWAAGETNAQAILEAWLAGEKTEESFAALANEKSQDPGSNTNGGLYTDVEVGQMVEEFENWCFDESRQVGDYGIVKTDLGYHVMYFSGSEPIWKTTAREDLVTEMANEKVAQITAKHPMKVDYSAIVLGFVDMSA